MTGDLLGGAAPALEWAVAASAGIYRAAAEGTAWIRAPAALLLLGLLGVGLVRHRAASGPARSSERT